MNVHCSLLMLVRLQLCSHLSCRSGDWGLFFFLKVLILKGVNNNYQTSKMKVNKVISRNRNLLNAINSLGVASYNISLFCHLPLGNKTRISHSQGKGKHQRTDDSTCICIIVSGTCFSLIKSLCCLKLQIWFYHHKIINFIYPFVLEQINL